MYQSIRSAVASDMDAVDAYIVAQLHSQVPLVENIGHYIVDAGGKRLRPILVLLAARCCGDQAAAPVALAAVIEFIHTATLLHDDVVDMSTLRRGRPTVNAEWNNPSSVLVGDFIYSRAFQLLVGIGDMRIMDIMADTTNKIAEGEVLQLINKNNPASTEHSYMQVIHNKTAILFEAAAHCGAILAGADASIQDALRRYGMHIGTAFQLIDDALDYDGDATSLGKNVGDDLAEGKPTLPLIHAMTQCSPDEADLIRECLSNKSPLQPETLEKVITIVAACGSLDYTRGKAREQADLALTAIAGLSGSVYADALSTLAEFSVARSV
ncbi:MAG: polyprenyl synthetase family protein [Gammaproteobacteria bacterium]|jgi:octaprenyl-diphosphate synthase|nr:polyprenyl synthetase family protein [Gammaproteobacteria bacterium]